MNKDFLKATLLTLLIIIFIGAIAWLVPGCEKGFVRIKPLKWFSWLIDKPDSTSNAALDKALLEAENYRSKTSPLEAFLAKLEAAKANQGGIRIAYFGDSIIEGDLITQQLRYNLQSRFGGNGIGFVPITSIVANFRRTIRHSFAKNWETMSFMTPFKPDYPLGLGGFVYIPRNFYTVQKAITAASDSLIDSLATFSPSATKPETQKFYVDTPPWVKYQTTNVNGGAKQLDRIRLFYSHAQPGSSLQIGFDDKPAQRFDLMPGEAVQTLDLSRGFPIKSLYLEFSSSDPVHVYGVSFDQAGGVYVDNFSIRGYSGMYFQRIPKAMLEQFQSKLSYDLIVLQYGENVSNPKATSYNFYRTGMIKTIKYLQAAFPQIPILLVSAHDRSIKVAERYQTSPDIPILIKAQADIADSTGCAFWNLYEAMGGKDSMQKYVKNVPPLAAKDYTHFNQSGANKIADMLTDFLLNRKK
jgi:lysophospholipase L1-like esterase